MEISTTKGESAFFIELFLNLTEVKGERQPKRSQVFARIKKNVSGNVAGVETGGPDFRIIVTGGKVGVGSGSIKNHIEAFLSSLER